VGFRVVTLNVWGIPVFSQARRARLSRLPHLLASLAPDVVCLQEVWWKCDARLIMRRIGAGWGAVRSDRGGLLICTPHPVSFVCQEAFPWDWGVGLEENAARKGVLVVCVVVKGHRVCVATTHAALRTSSTTARSRQMGVILRALTPVPLPTVLAGDFNAEPADASGEASCEFRVLRAAGFQHADPAHCPDRPVDPHWATSVGWPRGHRSVKGPWRDHVFLRDGGGGRLQIDDVRLAMHQERSAVSDHNALVVDVLLRAHDPSPNEERPGGRGVKR
jgi:endonuclease/exonuclease/phosphatase family metal-dependent hydrolase